SAISREERISLGEARGEWCVTPFDGRSGSAEDLFRIVIGTSGVVGVVIFTEFFRRVYSNPRF
ncbi:MAG TPA: hypothetical protein VIJ14_07055, partial [Rhabdochlamydiaceae bacterium]